MNTSLPQHHPDKNLLIEYASGSLDHGLSIAVRTHLHYCAKCRAEVMNLERIGGAIMMSGELNSSTENQSIKQAQPEISTDKHFNSLMQRIHQLEKTSDINKANKADSDVTSDNLPKHYHYLPKVIRKILPKTVRWKRVTPSLRSTHLVAGQDQYALSLQKIQAGGRVPQHNHRGPELTVVLKGSFSDEYNVYQQGDFLMKQKGDIHSPIASKNEDCLCLSVEQAPVKLTSPLGHLLNPFLRIQAL